MASPCNVLVETQVRRQRHAKDTDLVTRRDRFSSSASHSSSVLSAFSLRRLADIRCLTSGTGTVSIVGYRRTFSWWRGTVVERRSLTGELSLSCPRPAADG